MKNIKRIFGIIILIILIPILFVNLVILLNSFIHPDKVPSFFGWKPFIVLSGSMESEIFPGDIAIVKEEAEDSLKENDIIAFKKDDLVITHRIVKINNGDGKKKYITKGDNNNAEDNDFVLYEDIEGKYMFKISRLGNLAMFIQTPIGIIVSLSIPFILLLIIQITDSRYNKKYFEEKIITQKKMEEEIEKLKKQNEELKKK